MVASTSFIWSSGGIDFVECGEQKLCFQFESTVVAFRGDDRFLIRFWR